MPDRPLPRAGAPQHGTPRLPRGRSRAFLDICLEDFHNRYAPSNTFLMEPKSVGYIQVLSNGSDTGIAVPSVFLFFDRKRYLFNASEGLQRYILENRATFGQINGIMLTRTTTDASGGLAGACPCPSRRLLLSARPSPPPLLQAS